MNVSRLWFLILGSLACTGAPLARVPEPRPEPALPPLPAEMLTVPESPPAVPRARNPITLRAVDADARSLLVAVAEVAGFDLILSPEVRGRISLRLEQVPADEALTALMEALGLSSPGVLKTPWGAAVFAQPPVLLDTLQADAIARRFGVSRELAAWIVAQRAR
jgi:hypothetical protein